MLKYLFKRVLITRILIGLLCVFLLIELSFNYKYTKRLFGSLNRFEKAHTPPHSAVSSMGPKVQRMTVDDVDVELIEKIALPKCSQDYKTLYNLTSNSYITKKTSMASRVILAYYFSFWGQKPKTNAIIFAFLGQKTKG
jgi:hypothetical protein